MDAEFSAKLGLRRDISKISGSIGSTITSDAKRSLFTEPSVTTMDNLERSISSILKPDEISDVVKVISANQP